MGLEYEAEGFYTFDSPMTHLSSDFKVYYDNGKWFLKCMRIQPLYENSDVEIRYNGTNQYWLLYSIVNVNNENLIHYGCSVNKWVSR